MTEWIAIIISVIALIVSIFFSYQTTLKKKAKIHYFESWDAHLGTLLPRQAKRPFLGEFILKVIPFHMYMLYNIELENRGDKESGPIQIKLNNLKELQIRSEENFLNIWGNTLRWEPLTFASPKFENGTLKLDKLPPYYHLRIFTILPLSKQKTDILERDIPYIVDMKCDKVSITRMNEAFEEGSLKRLRDRLQNQFDSERKKLNEQ